MPAATPPTVTALVRMSVSSCLKQPLRKERTSVSLGSHSGCRDPYCPGRPHLYLLLLSLLLGAGLHGGCAIVVEATEWGKSMMLLEVRGLLKIRVVVEATALELETMKRGRSV